MCKYLETVDSRAKVHSFNVFALPMSIANYYKCLDKAAWRSLLTCLRCLVAELEEGRSGLRGLASGGDPNLRVESPTNSIHDASVSLCLFVRLIASKNLCVAVRFRP